MNPFVTVVVAGCAAVILSSVPVLAAQAPQAQEHEHAAADMAAKDKTMMAARATMMADMNAADQRLDALVVKMNAASGTGKTTATAAVVTEMVTQRRTMRDNMMKMQDGMMAHMMEHMQAGTASMAMCPMMTPAGDTKR
ncbi:MAG: hypothetical protein ABL986_20425 [Vicinamibacterales bacterium]